MRLDGWVATVTGAGPGIGAANAHRLAAAAAQVADAGIQREAMDTFAAKVTGPTVRNRGVTHSAAADARVGGAM